MSCTYETEETEKEAGRVNMRGVGLEGLGSDLEDGRSGIGRIGVDNVLRRERIGEGGGGEA